MQKKMFNGTKNKKNSFFELNFKKNMLLYIY